ncbi:BLUF domain-containing protein [Temperatibacter marinus]|uniref:BLUF domain-containing protein n=1 Tax=Temperatibacter marinus TaxID=1456591 RepID=A0AA52EBQ5_9PROT|nr:BLUF domain-containing protein [Temperatibacter marinus]WND02417.1 BLUF domain-containing protein [Temperatibacter marinus]
MPSQLSQLVYYSEVNEQNKLELESLLHKAQDHNSKNYITGALWAYGKFYIQVLEGERAKVSDLYHNICADPHHNGVVLVGCIDIEERDFADWWMAFIMDTDVNREAILKYSCSDRLEPRKMSHQRLIQLMKTVKLSQTARSD